LCTDGSDWLELWRKLVTINTAQSGSGRRLHRYELHSQVRTDKSDLLLEFILDSINKDTSVLDVGAGSGRWTIPIAKVAKRVTAVEPSDIMVKRLQENIATSNVANVHIVLTPWEEAEIQPHDIVVCAHAIYGSPDFAAFVVKMEQQAKDRCYLALRLPAHNGIIGELSYLIRGCRHDSPNAVVAYNAFYSIGICANVLAEEEVSPWVDSSLEEASARAKRHLRLESSTHDRLIRDILARRLIRSDSSYIWPDGMRSALLWWRQR